MTNTFKCSKRELLLPYIKEGRKLKALSTVLKEKYHVSEDNLCFIISDIQRNLIHPFNKRWTKAFRKKDSFLKKNENWLNSEYLVTLPIIEVVTPENSPSTFSRKRGRPCVSYEDSSEPTKRQKKATLLSQYGFESICEAYTQGLRSIGEEVEAKLVEKLRLADRDTMILYLNLIENASQSKMLSDQERH